MGNWLKGFWWGWIAPMACLFVGHDWHYFDMRRLDGGLEHYRCCMRCENTDPVVVE